MIKSNFSYVVIEDELTVCESIKSRMSVFENWTCLGLIAFYDKAAELIKEKKPDLLMLDYSIRGGNTFDLLRLVESMEGYSPYVIFFTAYLSDQPEIAEDAVNIYKVNKYLNKPIFEKLTQNLKSYIEQAERWLNTEKSSDVWIEKIDKIKVKIEVESIICITQSRSNPRNKIVYLKNLKEIEFRGSWTFCLQLITEKKELFYFTNDRDTLINTAYVSKVQKPFLWLDERLKINVTKSKWKELSALLDL